MKTRIRICCLVALLSLSASVTRADNPCVGTPTTNSIQCTEGTLSAGYALSQTNFTVTIGQPIPQLTVYNLSITNGSETYYYSNVCDPQMDGWYSYGINYTFSSLYFDPSFPSVLWNSGVYTYTGLVDVAGSLCGPWTTNVGIVTVEVTNIPDVLIDVDFGTMPASAKSGYAAIGDSPGDYWNEYNQTDVLSGSLSNLWTAEKQISPVGLFVANLPIYGTNASTDPMYRSDLSTNGATGTLTLTNLPAGVWNIYLYSTNGNFDLLTLDTNNNVVINCGTQTCYDPNPGSSVLWQQGVQYVVFTNVVVGSGQTVLVNVSPGTSGVAMVSGLQVASAWHQASFGPTDHVLAYYPFDGNANDVSGNNLNATVSGATLTSDRFGNANSAYAFNGSSSYMSVSDPNGLLNFDVRTNSYTIALWVKLASLTQRSEFLIDRGTTRNSASSYDIFYDNGSHKFAVVFWDGMSGSELVWLSSVTSPVTNVWYHLALVCNDGGLGLYVNGLPESGPPASGCTNQLYAGFTSTRNNEQVRDFGRFAGSSYGEYANGSIDDIIYYGRALSADEVFALYSAGPDSATQDSDYDGVSDLHELADRTDPHNPSSVLHLELGSWSFQDTNAWTGDQGQVPLAATNIAGVTDWTTSAVIVNTNKPAVLCYRDVETNGDANINVRAGSIRFWFYPQWSSANQGGTRPGVWGRLIEMGNYNSAFTNGWWSVYVSPDGNNLLFGTSTNGGGMTNLIADISWASNEWHEIVLTYDTNRSSLYLDGQLATNGAGTLYFPNLAERASGFRIGSDVNGANQGAGIYAELATFNYPVSADWVASDFANAPLLPSAFVSPPVLTIQPTNQSVLMQPGNYGTASFSASMGGNNECDGPAWDEWLHDGTNIGDMIITIAGNAWNGYSGASYFGNGVPATNSILNEPNGVALDSSGNVYIADTLNNVIRKIDTNGMITTVAGDCPSTNSGAGGPAVEANLNPIGTATDAHGNLYISDGANEVVYKVATNGILSIFAGQYEQSGYTNDTEATNACLNYPWGVAVDAVGNVYISENGDDVVQMVDTNGIITTVAGNYAKGHGYSGDGGSATNATLISPTGIAVDKLGKLYIAEYGGQIIRMVNTNGIITTIAGAYSVGSFSGDGGQATNADLNMPADVAVDTNENIYIADKGNNCVRVINANGIIETYAGGGSSTPGDGVVATNAQFSEVFAVALDANGKVYIGDSQNDAVWTVSTNGVLTNVAGIFESQGFSGDGGLATNAQLATYNSASGAWLGGELAVDCFGNLYIADSGNAVVREVKTNGIINTVAGIPSGEHYFGDGGPATSAILNNPQSVAVDPLGNMYIADSGNNVIRKVDANGIITTVAGDRAKGGGFSGDGDWATNAALSDPSGVAVDAKGDLYIADSENDVIRMVSTNNKIATVAGTDNGSGYGDAGYNGDGGPATNALLSYPEGIAVDTNSNLYIADSGNNVIRMVNANGKIATVAGDNSLGAGYSGDDGPATNAVLNSPYGVVLDPTGNLYIADYGNGLIRKVDTNGIITTVVGNYLQTINAEHGWWHEKGDDGPALRAWLSWPSGVTVGAAGNIFIADSGNNCIRETVDNLTNMTLVDVTTNDIGSYQMALVTPCGSVTSSVATLNPIVAPYVIAPPTNTEVILGSNAVFSVTVGGTPPFCYQWSVYNNYSWIPLANETNATLVILDVQTNDEGTYSVIITNSAGTSGQYECYLSVITPPMITQQPATQNVLEGNNVAFNLTATSLTPMGYQWYFDSTQSLAGQTNSTLALTNAQSADIGSYSVVITNCAGDTTSALAQLTIQLRPYVALTNAAIKLTNYVFQNDTTYLIGTNVGLYSNTVIEGGSVLKFATNGTLNVYGPLTCKTGPYRPALLTSENDDSAGMPIPGSTGSPQTCSNGLAYINFQGWNWSGGTSAGATISYLRIAYADKGIAVESGLESRNPDSSYTNALHVWDCQFVDCNWGLADWSDANVAGFDLHNVLFGACQSALGGATSTNTVVTGEQITCDTQNFWDTTSNTLASVSLTNCIILGNFQFGSGTTLSTNCVALASSENVFQQVGAGNYYLPNGSPYHNAGTTNISPQMKAELAQKTTYPPNVMSDETLNNYYQNFTPIIHRDTGVPPNQQSPIVTGYDLGFNYDVIDWAFSMVNLVNGNVEVLPGTVVAAYASYSQTRGDAYGLDIDGGSQFISEGHADNLARIVQYNTVQEQATSDWREAVYGSIVCDYLGEAPAPSITCRFTDWSVMSFDTYHLFENSSNCAPINLQDCCQFHGGLLVSSYATVNITNCLFERVYTSLESADGNTPTMLNNLFWHGSFYFAPVNGALVNNNLFDGTVITPTNNISYTGGFNAFVTNQDRLNPPANSDVILTNALAYEVSSFGDYYQPTNSPLIGAGSTTADQMGLYHYTVVTNQIAETNGPVSIGYHYVACDTNGNPFCTSGNGIPDYLADTNGNGLGDWADYYQGSLPLLNIVYGDGQYGYLSNFLYESLVVEVTDDQYNPLTNAPITFTVSNALDELCLTTNAAAGVSNLVLRTDQSGYAVVDIYFPSNTPATNVVYVTAESGDNATQITSTDMVIFADTPVIDPAGGRYTTIQNVSISSDTPGAVVHYTRDGTTPNGDSPVLPTGQSFIISQPGAVEAQAIDANVTLPSLIKTANFTFANPLSAGSDFTLVLDPYGNILAGGSNGQGQLGDGTTVDSPHLTNVLNLTDAAGIAAGGLHSLAWDTNGNAWSWGDNSDGQLGNGTTTGETAPVQISGISKIIAMAGGDLHSLALDSNGIVWAWGANGNGQLGNGTTTQETTPVQVSSVNNIIALAAGGSHSLALASNGIVYAWGNDASGQLGNGTTTSTPQETPISVIDFSNCLEIAAGYSHSLAIASNETVVAWGDNTYGQMGNGNAGGSQSTPASVSGLSNIVAVAAGQYHSLALRSDGTVWAWGNNSYGQVGNGTTATAQTMPVPVIGLSNVLAIAAGWAHSAALKSDGTVVIWGATNYGLNGVSGQFSTVPVTSDPSTNVDWQPPVIVSQPISQDVFYGDTVTFSVGAIGQNLRYQWTYGGNVIPGATNANFTIEPAGFNQYGEGTYAVTVANGMASVVSSNADLTLEALALAVDPLMVPLVGPRQNYTFESGVTYWVLEPVQLYGQTIIQGGATIKFDNPFDEYYGLGLDATNAGALQVFGSVTCESGPYNPAYLTSADDDGPGEIAWDSSGPYYYGQGPEPYPSGTPFLDLTAATNVTLSNLRFGYADQAIAAPTNGTLDVWDCQFVTNNSAVMVPAGGDVRFHNALFSGCGCAVNGSTNTFSVEAEQITACVDNFWTASNGCPVSVSLTNSVIVGGSSALKTSGSGVTYSSLDVSFADPTNFVVSGAGNYYLAPNSSLHQSGTTAVSQRLLDEFQNKTTSAPLAFPALMEMDGNMTLYPTVPRYTNGPIDRGFYYDALDYTVACITMYQGSLTVEPGTVVGARNDMVTNYGLTEIGFNMENGSAFTSRAMPNKPNTFADVQSVQEGYEWPVMADFVLDYFPSGEIDNDYAPPTLNFRFSHFYLNYCGYSGWVLPPDYNGAQADYFAAGDAVGPGIWSACSAADLALQDCQFDGGSIDLGYPDGYARVNDWVLSDDYVYGSADVSWINNSFDNVSINITPSWNWFGWNDQGPNVNMTFTAFNNLFKGGEWFGLESFTNGQNWVLEDNLFDKSDIYQDTNEPLDYAYNAYWPKQPWEMYGSGEDAAELEPTTTGDGFEDGTGDLILSNAPPYQSGPFGDFYMPTNTPLFGAGSTNAAGLGLFHYTTRLDQVIEGDEPSGKMVDIGVHYIAATNLPGTPLYEPVDSDGDGIPDYVEDADGNGIVDTNDGTDWTKTYTDGVTWDPTNDVYVNADLSGDGLAGRIKNALGIDPFSPTNPLTLMEVGDSNQNAISFELPIHYSVLTNIGYLSLNLDGHAANMAGISPASNGNTLLTWNSIYDLPGQHYLQAMLTLNGTGNDSDVLTAFGPVMSFYSANLMRFFEADSVFDPSDAYLDAQLTQTNADYTIQLYDPSTNPPTLLDTINGSTADGVIQEDWGVTNAHGTSFSGNSVDAVFSVSLPDSVQEQSTHVLTRLGGTEQGNGFDFAYMYTPHDNSLETDLGNYFGKPGNLWLAMDSVVDTLLAPQFVDFGSSTNYKSGFNHYDDEMGVGILGIPGYISSEANLTNGPSIFYGNGLFYDMTNSETGAKNFFCYCHGTHDWIGNFPALGDPINIKADEIGHLLGNEFGIFSISVNDPYRFVWLDGCNTGIGPDWPDAFGIFDIDLESTAARQNVGPQAYVGWGDAVRDMMVYQTNWLWWPLGQPVYDHYKSVCQAWAYSQTLSAFYNNWMLGFPLAECIASASVNNIANGSCPIPVPQSTDVIIWGNSPYGFYHITYSAKDWNSQSGPIYVVGHSGLTRSFYDPTYDNKYLGWHP